MPKPPDRVQISKQESAAGGGDALDADDMLQSPLDPSEDAIDVAGVFLQEDTGGGVSSADEVVAIYREASEAYFEDTAHAGASRVSLGDLVLGAGLDPDKLLSTVAGAQVFDDSGNAVIRS